MPQVSAPCEPFGELLDYALGRHVGHLHGLLVDHVVGLYISGVVPCQPSYSFLLCQIKVTTPHHHSLVKAPVRIDRVFKISKYCVPKYESVLTSQADSSYSISHICSLAFFLGVHAISVLAFRADCFPYEIQPETSIPKLHSLARPISGRFHILGRSVIL